MYHLSIGTRNDRISLIDEWGFMLYAWRPVAGDHESVVRESPLADYEQLVRYRDVAVTETYELKLRHRTEDRAFRATQDMRRMLRLAIEYWAHDWQTEPVYVKKRARCETGLTYALVLDARMPEDDQYHVRPFLNADPVMDDLALIVRRGPWLSEIPGDSVCLEAWGGEDWCWPSYLEFGATGDVVNCGSAAHLNDLPLASFTVDAWVRADSLGGSAAGRIVSKAVGAVGWALHIDPGQGLRGFVLSGGGNAISESGFDDFYADGRWHHVLMYYDIGTRLIYLYVDGHQVTYSLQQAAAGVYGSDAANNLFIGNDAIAGALYWDGGIGWTKVRSGTPDPFPSPGFIPSERCLVPVLDGTDEGFWIYEGTGSTTENLLTPGTSDGTITGADWECECTKSRGISTTFSEDERCYPSFLSFGAQYEAVRCGSEAEIDDMPTAGPYFTVEAWVRPKDWGGTNFGRIATKSALGSGWGFYIDAVNGLVAFVAGATNAISRSGTDDFSPDNRWHHVAMVYDPFVLRISLFIDGVEPSYTLQQVGVAPYTADAGAVLVLGNDQVGNVYWEGDIGWVRISDNQRYFGTFTPPDRCTVPDDDANTYGTWIYDEDTDVTWNVHNYGVGIQTHGSILGAEDNCEGCIESAGGRTGCYPGCLHFDGILDSIQFGSPAALNDLPVVPNAFTAEAWVRFDGWGWNNRGRIFDKENTGVPSGWRFNVDNTAGLGAIFRHTVQNASVNTGLGFAGATPDGLWHHMAVTFDNGGTRLPHIWIDGVEPTVYGLQQAAIGNYVADAATGLYGGNDPLTAFSWLGRIGWMRISDSIRYTADFTPPPRCTIPDVDANTVGLWVYEGAGPVTYNRVGTASTNGVIVVAYWVCECDYELGTSCQTPAYVANKRNTANITHIVVFDAGTGTLGPNLVGTRLPYRLFSSSVTVGDIVYFGIAADYDDAGPFCSLVFDVAEPASNVTGIAWEYASAGPAWNGMSVRDNTNSAPGLGGIAFDTVGINSVHWSQDQAPAFATITLGAATDAIGQVEGWWIRARVTGIAGAQGTPPLQQSFDPFTITWPHLEIPAEEIKGDIPAYMRFTYQDEADASLLDFYYEKLIVGTRSNDRGANFASFLNFDLDQNPPGIRGTGGTADVRAASGEVFYWNAAGPASTLPTIDITPSVVADYVGKYRCLLRAEQATGVAGDVQVWVVMSMGTGAAQAAYYTGEVKVFRSNNEFQLIDLGAIDIVTQLEQEIPNEVQIQIHLNNTAAAAPGVTLFDVAIIPTDEWTAEFVANDIEAAIQGQVDARRTYLDVDPLSHPRQTPTSAFVKIRDTTRVHNIMQVISSQTPILQENKDQRIWFLGARKNTSSPYEWRSYPYSAGTAWIYDVLRYLAGRGDR